MTENTERITQLREKIDAVDDKLVQLLVERASLAHDVGIAKGKATVYRPEREREIIERVIQRAQASGGKLSESALAQIFREIMSACRSLEKPMSVAYLGPQGTFCEMAAIRAFGHGVTMQACPSIDEAFRAAETGQVDYAVVPIENSAQGTVTRTLDLLVRTSLCIVGEVNVPVVHNLMSRAVSLTDVKRVSAHPQALAQCRNWLASHLPGAELVPAASNAKAAQAAGADASMAAIAAERAAELYKLTILASAIQDDTRNRTRFFILGKTPVRAVPTHLAKTSVWFVCANVSGGLCQVLEPFKEHGVSMVKLESRPARTGGWEYTFYVDIEGFANDANVSQALCQMKQCTSVLKVLGSYPKAVDVF